MAEIWNPTLNTVVFIPYSKCVEYAKKCHGYIIGFVGAEDK